MYNAKCNYENQVKKFCIEKQCKKIPFVCQEKQCQCSSDHEKCARFCLWSRYSQEVNQILSNLYKQKIQPYEQKIYKILEKLKAEIDQQAIYFTNNIKNQFFENRLKGYFEIKVKIEQGRYNQLVSQDLTSFLDNLKQIQQGIYSSQLYQIDQPEAESIQNKFKSLMEEIRQMYTHPMKNFNNGQTYRGSYVNGLRDGKGKCIYMNGDQYQGEWKQDKRCGRGKYIHRQDQQIFSIYQGQWKNDKRQGYGTIKYFHGTLYIGHWKQDMREGKGYLKYAKGDEYFGEFKQDKLHGRGILFKESTLYMGDFKANQMHGFGILQKFESKRRRTVANYKNNIHQFDVAQIYESIKK